MEILKKAVRIIATLIRQDSGKLVIYDVDGHAVYSEDPFVPVVVKLSSIWDTIEADAWSRNYTFKGYKDLCAQQGIAHVTEFAYKTIYQALTAIRDMEFP